MSLWTPGGEVPVSRKQPDRAAEPERAARREPSGAADAPLDQLSPEDREQIDAMVAQMLEQQGHSIDQLSPDELDRARAVVLETVMVQQQIAGAPAAVIVANHAEGLVQLAAIKLQQSPPMLEDGQLAIDALAAMLDVVGDRLGADGQALAATLRDLQLLFVNVRDQTSG